jgi:cyclohexa-1,5-dienecarbonyl-CoA hydratase
MSDYQFITWSQSDGVGRLSLNSPPLNVLTIPMMREMDAAMDAAAEDSSLKALVFDAVEGSKAFSAGVDIADHTAEKVGDMIDTFHHVFRVLAQLEIPTLAVVNGAALGGGCELALFCDMIVASERAKFGQPEIQVGVFPPIAAVALPAIIGPKRAAELLMTGNRIGAEEALQMGLVNRVVPTEKLAEATDELLGALTSLSGAALRMTKRAYRIGNPDDFVARLTEVEKLYLGDLMDTHDAHEGLEAFMEKRAPVWTDS